MTCSSDLAPVMTNFPERKTRAVVFGSRIRMITAANLCAYTNREGGHLGWEG